MSVPEKQVSALFSVNGGIADEAVLPAYDVGHLLIGIARASNIIAHAFSSNDEIRKRADSAHSVQTLVTPSRKGCFEEEIIFRFSTKLAEEIGLSVIANAFWDYYAFSWSSAIGEDYRPKTPFLRRRILANDVLGPEMAEALESALQDVHRPIVTDRDLNIEIIRPRVGTVLNLDSKTLDYTATQEDPSQKITIVANVTRFNIISGFGRFFVQSLQRVVPFKVADSRDSELMKKAGESMTDSQINFGKGKRKFRVHLMSSAQGQLKRYVVHQIS